MALGKVNHLHFAVDDLEGTVKYFTEKLGFKPQSLDKRPGRPSVGLMSPAGDLLFDFVKVSDKLKEVEAPVKGWPYLCHVAFEVEDAHKESEELRKKGVTYVSEPDYNPKSGRTLGRICDADGRRWIQLQEIKPK